MVSDAKQLIPFFNSQNSKIYISMNNNEQTWKSYFPYTPRKEQTQILDFIFDNMDKKYIVAEAPTGVGKSAIAYTLSRYYTDHKIDKGKLASMILTPEIILQKQYCDEFSDLANIFSRRKYKCTSHKITCEVGNAMNELLKKSGRKYCDCIYGKEKKKFLESETSLTNLAYFLNVQTEQLEEPSFRRNILIIDEAHNIEKSIIGFSELRITKGIVNKLGLDWINKTNHNLAKLDSYDLLRWITDTLRADVTIKLKDIEIEINKFSSTLFQTNIHPNLSILLEKKETIELLLNKISILRAWFDTITRDMFEFKNTLLVYLDEDDTAIIIKPLKIQTFTKKLLFDLFDKVVLMSATILNKDQFCNDLGIPQNDCAYISVNSPFPAKNRPIEVLKCGSMSRKFIDKTLPTIAKTIQALINLPEHKNSKGIIFAPSYAVAEYVKKSVRTDRIILHDSTNRMAKLDEHLKSKSNTILLSPSFTEGIDLKDEFSRFQIIIKTPFPYLGDHYIMIKKELSPSWYACQTVKTIMQASGRSIRNENDYAETYILDSDFVWFYNYNRKLFPKWWTDALHFN